MRDQRRVEKNKKTNKHVINPVTKTCPHIKAHEDNTFDSLSQEQDSRNLNKN